MPGRGPASVQPDPVSALWRRSRLLRSSRCLRNLRGPLQLLAIKIRSDLSFTAFSCRNASTPRGRGRCGFGGPGRIRRRRCLTGVGLSSRLLRRRGGLSVGLRRRLVCVGRWLSIACIGLSGRLARVGLRRRCDAQAAGKRHRSAQHRGCAQSGDAYGHCPHSISAARPRPSRPSLNGRESVPCPKRSKKFSVTL